MSRVVSTAPVLLSLSPVEQKSACAVIVSRPVDEKEWDELILAIADELTELGRKRLEYEVFARRVESEVRELTGLRGLVSDDFVGELLERAQALLRISDFPPAMDPWEGLPEPPPFEPERARKASGVQAKVTLESLDYQDEDTKPGIPRAVMERYRKIS